MFQQLLNWRVGLAFIAILIVSGTIVYSQYVSRKIAKEERGRVTAFGESLKISRRTVEVYRKNLIQKLGVRNTVGVVKFALTQSWN